MKRMVGIIAAAWICLVGQQAWAENNIVITYDVSGSMYAKNRGQEQYYLSAGEFREISRIVQYLVFSGDPYENNEFRQIREGRFLTEPVYLSDDYRGGFWKDLDDIIYIEYASSASTLFDSRYQGKFSQQQLTAKLDALLPYPKNIGVSQQTNTPDNRREFSAVFPGASSLQQYAEFNAFKIFDELVEGVGKANSKVIWIKISDEDMDHTGDSDYKKISNDLEKEIFNIKKKYPDCKAFNVYKTKFADQIWLNVYVLSKIETTDYENILKEWENKLKNAEAKWKSDEKALKDRLASLEQMLENERNSKANAIFLTIDGEKVVNQKFDNTLAFKRQQDKTADGVNAGSVYSYTGIRITHGKDLSDANFRIQTMSFCVMEDGKKIKEMEILPIPGFNCPINLAIPADDAIIGKTYSGLFRINHEYVSNEGQPIISSDKSWELAKVSFPGPSALGRVFGSFWWVIAVVMAVFIAVWLFRGGPRGDAPGRDNIHLPVPENVDTEEYPERLIQSGDSGVQIASTGENSRDDGASQIRLSSSAGEDFYIDRDSSKVSLSYLKRMPNQRVWDLECTSHSVHMENGRLFLDGNEIKDNEATLVNDHGETVTIRIKAE